MQRADALGFQTHHCSEKGNQWETRTDIGEQQVQGAGLVSAATGEKQHVAVRRHHVEPSATVSSHYCSQPFGGIEQYRCGCERLIKDSQRRDDIEHAVEENDLATGLVAYRYQLERSFAAGLDLPQVSVSMSTGHDRVATRQSENIGIIGLAEQTYQNRCAGK
jgi:hypothetical protein